MTADVFATTPDLLIPEANNTHYGFRNTAVLIDHRRRQRRSRPNLSASDSPSSVMVPVNEHLSPLAYPQERLASLTSPYEHYLAI